MTLDQPTHRVLGSLDVRPAGRPLRIGGPKPRTLLATLLLDANRTVGTELLVDVLWPRSRPRSAVANLRTYASALRAALGPTGAVVQARPGGYAIEVPPGDLDLLIFEELVARAGRDPADAPAHLRRALALWRGPVLSDLPGSPLWDRRIQEISETRLRASEDSVAWRLAAREYPAAIAELRGLLAEHPFREDLWQRLMLALHWSGRQAEALRCYGEIRRQLVAELGVEPGPELRRVHLAILSGNTTALPEPASASSDASSNNAVAVLAPRQLPPDVPDFTGRAEAVAALLDALTLAPPPQSPDGPPAIAVIVGPPGVGKSALAVHCAQAVRDRFPHGQLYLCLGGVSGAPAEPADLLAEALRALGAAGAALPYGLHERAALYRSLLAERPMLVLLDDAAGGAQVRHLLPGTGSAVLVTSRRRITEIPGAVLVELDALPRSEAVELLGRIAGADRVGAEPESATAIVQACGCLPLAVRIAGARLAGRPGRPLRVLEQRLADESTRLGELCVGDLEVRESLDRSYRLLPADAARALRALGTLGSHPLPAWVVDAILDRHHADDVTDVLVDESLLRPVGVDTLGRPRYRLHDLVRCDARERAERDPEPHALARVVGAWLVAAEQAAAGLPTTLFSVTPTAAARWTPADDALGRLAEDPLSWFDQEQDALLRAVELAAEAGLAGSAWGLAAVLVPFFDLRCHLDAWQRTHQAALDAARAAGDRHGEAAMLRGLAQVCLYQDRYRESAEMFRRSRAMFRQVGDTRGEAISICGLGAVTQFRNDHATAFRYFQQALAMFLRLDDRQGEAYARQAVGRVLLRSGDLAQAAEWLDGAMRLARDMGDAHREGCVSMQVGRLHDLSADADAAMRFHGRALDIFERLGDRHCGAYAMQGVGGIQAARGDFRHASIQLERSLTIFQQLGDLSGAAASSQMLGELHRSAGRTGLARDYLDRAVCLRRGLRAGAGTASG
ncbi:BTAD domain-containing putative transcriptional regulator [Microtetraspora sp. NBRC 16547]|uniref:AfsR/SARP family transcriptional regulator n=1 Tax=Microtetraspora sp. NBRC 16547 TaxID=3030993 RepID=UPI0024A5DD79|nr:BTAD domain-containing putative transcriptional regulator [Microtetraspora sp. NBRC 16547]GLW98454.1 SARP family transcriptional regulator [Microtetraspora sp. NBRC 16547]